jgi:hypothetical protein
MTMKECTSFDSSIVSTTNANEHDEKDISKVFSRLRAHLYAKEKELLELQRADPSLLAPDSAQIGTLLDTIGSLHLSTPEGNFALASVSPSDASTGTPICSTGVDSIKVWPSTVWLPDPTSTAPIPQEEEQNSRRLPMVTHLFSLPINAYIASSSSPTVPPPILATIEVEDQPSNRLPMVSQLLSMPINAFVTSSVSTPKAPETSKDTVIKNTNVSSATPTVKSVLSTETVYSKEYWLRTSSPDTSSSSSEPIPFDLDAHIEECSVKMRRLHAEYLTALEKIETPSSHVDCSQSINSIYPQVFDRVKTSMSNLACFLPSNK